MSKDLGLSYCDDESKSLYIGVGTLLDEVFRDDDTGEGFILNQCLTSTEIEIARPEFEGEDSQLTLTKRNPEILSIIFKKILNHLKSHPELKPTYFNKNEGNLFEQYGSGLTEIIEFCEEATKENKELYWSFSI